MLLVLGEWGSQLSRVRMAEDHTTAVNGARFNCRVRNGIGWVPRPMAGNPKTNPMNRQIYFSIKTDLKIIIVKFWNVLECECGWTIDGVVV
mgnify:CR=1 FL=1